LTGSSSSAAGEMLQRALALHRGGAVAKAASLYEAILAREPRHFDALHLWGVLEAQRRVKLPDNGEPGGIADAEKGAR
jgi:hypothetical protein